MNTPESNGSSGQSVASLEELEDLQRRQKLKKKRARRGEPIEAFRMLLNPKAKAVSPYSPKSELEDSQLRFLIYHYVTVVTAKTVTNVGPRFEWYPLAVRDEAFFHAVISSTSSHAAYLQDVDLPRNFYFHRGEAIRLVNTRIANGAHDEGTINAVAVFTQQEAFEGRPDTARTHISGLSTIMRAAGGIQSQEMTEKTRRHLYFTDLATCITLNSKPFLEPRVNMSNLKAYFRTPSTETSNYMATFHARLLNFTGDPELSDVSTNTLWGLRNLSSILEAIHAGRDTPDTVLPTDIQFSDRVEVLERLIHPLWWAENPKEPQHPIFRTLGWTTLIYIYTILRELPKEMGINALVASRIRRILESSPLLNVLLATFQDLMLWQMFICGRISDKRDRPFFAQQATKILTVRKLENPTDIVVASEGFLWPEREGQGVKGVEIVVSGPRNLGKDGN